LSGISDIEYFGRSGIN